MQTPATEIDQMIVQLNEFLLPSSLMESFDVYREESVKSAARCFNDAQLSWFLDMLNRFRGPDDRKDSLVDIFDPGMYTCDHPAWEAAPGTRIEMPALTSELARLVDRNSEFAQIAKEEINEFRDHAETYADNEILGLAKIAASALVDQGGTFQGREEAIRYLDSMPALCSRTYGLRMIRSGRMRRRGTSSLTTWSQNARRPCSVPSRTIPRLQKETLLVIQKRKFGGLLSTSEACS